MIDTNNIMFVHIKGMVRVEGGGGQNIASGVTELEGG